MAIHDNNPERRNLVITSLAFIIFYLGNGSIVGDDIKIQMINITFNNPEFLKITAWIMLFWFALRYWQTHQKGEVYRFKEDAISLFNKQKHIKKHTGHKQHEDYDMGLITISSTDGKWTLLYHKKETDNEKKTIKLNEIKLKIGASLVYKCYLKALFKKSGFSSYIAPYILFYFAIFIALVYKFK